MKRVAVKKSPRKKGVNGKQKGGSFEREVCKRLSLLITKRKTDDVYWRSAMSGGRATVMNKKGIKNRHLGDISCVGEEGHWLTDHFVVECKNYRDLDIASGLFKQVGKLHLFWKQLYLLSFANGRYPMLIARQNMFPTLLITNRDGVEELRENNYMKPSMKAVAVVHPWAVPGCTSAFFFLFDLVAPK